MPYPPPRFYYPEDVGSQVASVETDPSEEVPVEVQAPVEQIVIPAQEPVEEPKLDEHMELANRVPVAPDWWCDENACCSLGSFDLPLESLPVAEPPLKKRSCNQDSDRDPDSNSEKNSHESDAEEGDDYDVASHDSSSEKTPSIEIPPEKSLETLSRKGNEPVLIASEEEESDDKELIKKLARKNATASASKNTTNKKKKGYGAQTPKTRKASQVPVPEKKKKKEKKEEKVAASTGRKRKHVSDTNSKPDVEQVVPDISTSSKKRVKGKMIPLNVPDAPMNNVSFHSAEFAQRWKFVFQRRVVVERELSEEALSYTKIMTIIEQVGLMKTVTGLGKCFIQLVREFTVNIPSDCDNEDSAEYRKMFVRGKDIDFSLEVNNTYLGRSPDAVTDEESDLDRVANTLTGKNCKLDGYSTSLWSDSTPGQKLYLIGTRGDFDFGSLVYEQTLKHVGSFAVKLPILFPCVLFRLILQQHPIILRADEPLGSFQDTTRHYTGLQVRKINIDQLIKALTGVHAVDEEEKVEEEAENAEDEIAAVEEEEAQYETNGEEDSESEKEEEESDGEEKEDVTGSTSSASLLWLNFLDRFLHMIFTERLPNCANNGE
ncbi:uncharacterized protein LOC130744087 [Lotus japonicus]|uniref:uncharacterized protein LOC130744087 n=1 Tax=Lotus japonicus TaxID=34305 RepID=UPI00258D46CC|nr:uncharacterized protein LOC130744087 [Lotus japonicus]